MGQLGHLENHTLNQVIDEVEKGFEPQAGQSSSFNTGQPHSVNETAKDSAQPQQSTFQQLFQQRAEKILASPSTASDAAHNCDSGERDEFLPVAHHRTSPWNSAIPMKNVKSARYT
jgi:hypothetical protein